MHKKRLAIGLRRGPYSAPLDLLPGFKRAASRQEMEYMEGTRGRGEKRGSLGITLYHQFMDSPLCDRPTELTWISDKRCHRNC